MQNFRPSCLIDGLLAVSIISLGLEQMVRSAERIAALDGARGIRVKISDAAGREIFDSGRVRGFMLDWNRRDRDGRPVPYGLYVTTVEMRDAFGAISRVSDTLALEAEAAVDGTGPVNFIPKFVKAGTCRLSCDRPRNTFERRPTSEDPISQHRKPRVMNSANISLLNWYAYPSHSAQPI